MSLKAVLFDFNGVIINDEAIHQKLIDQILIEENLRPNPKQDNQVCLGRNDRACLSELLMQRGRVVTDAHLTSLIIRKSQRYQREIAALERLPIYSGLQDLMFNIRAAQLKMAVVSGALHTEITTVLEMAQLSPYFSAIVGGDDVDTSKPEPEGYLLAVAQLNQQYPELNLSPAECLAIEDTPAGIQAAKRAGMTVVGVANTYPFHMMQRQSNWAVDYLSDLELERVQQVYSR